MSGNKRLAPTELKSALKLLGSSSSIRPPQRVSWSDLGNLQIEKLKVFSDCPRKRMCTRTSEDPSSPRNNETWYIRCRGRERTGGRKSLTSHFFMGRLLLLASTSLHPIHSGNWDLRTNMVGKGVEFRIRTCEKFPTQSLARPTALQIISSKTNRWTSCDIDSFDGWGRLFSCDAQKSHFFLCKEVDSVDSHSPQRMHPANLTWDAEIIVKLIFLSNYWGCFVSMFFIFIFGCSYYIFFFRVG